MSQTLIFTDFDGTIYNPNAKLLLAWRYNSRSSRLIRSHNIKLIITTGRSVWNNFSEFQNRFFGMHRADIVVSGAGTYIYNRQQGKLILDTEWNEKILKSEVTIQKTTSLWTKQLIEDAVFSTLDNYSLAIAKSPNPYQIVVPIYHMDVTQLSECIEKISSLIPKGIKILTTEKLYLFNSVTTFSGYLFIVPEIAGKDGSALYILKKQLEKSNTLFFGDAMVDYPMLSMKSPMILEKSAYALNPTPLVEEKIAEDTTIQKLKGNPPKLIYGVLKERFGGVGGT